MKITSIAYSNKLNSGKYVQLKKQAELLGVIRSEVWNRFGSIGGVEIKDRVIRDEWLKEKRNFHVSANAWKETLRDAMDDIKAYREAAKEKVKKDLRVREPDKVLRSKFLKTLASPKWIEDPYLRRKMRKHFRHGINHTFNQIVVRSDNYSVYELNGRVWIKIPGLEKGRRLAIPLKTNLPPQGTLRLILKNGCVEVHYQENVLPGKPCGTEILGIDKGFT